MGYMSSFYKQGIWITEKLVVQDTPIYSLVEQVSNPGNPDQLLRDITTKINGFIEKKMPRLDVE